MAGHRPIHELADGADHARIAPDQPGRELLEPGAHATAEGRHEVGAPRHAVSPALEAGVGLDPHVGDVEH